MAKGQKIFLGKPDKRKKQLFTNLQRIKQKVDPKIKIKNEDKIYFIVNSCFHFGIHCWERLSSAIFSIFWKHKGRK